MLAKFTSASTGWVKKLLAVPSHELKSWQRAARYAIDLVTFVSRALYEGRAPQMAAALAYRSLFALLPIVIVSTVLLKGLRGVEDFKSAVAWLIHAAGLDTVVISPPDGDEVVTSQPQRLGEWLMTIVDEFASVSLSTLGWVAIIVVVYSAITMMTTVENSFNAIYRAPGGRSWTRRVPLYWFVLTFGPLVVAMLVFVDAKVAIWLESRGGFHWLISISGALWSFGIAWLFLLLVYKLVPNTIVAWRPALVGSFVATLLLALGKQLLSAYFQKAFSLSALYGTLGLIPVFMFWVYLMWLVVLFGVELASIIQMLDGREPREVEPKKPLSGVVDPAAVLLVMQAAAEQFQLAMPVTTRHISDQAGLPEPIVDHIVCKLIEKGYLHRLERDDNSVTLARPPEQMDADQLLQIGFELVDEAGAGKPSPMLERLREAQRQSARETSLATMLAALPESAMAGPKPTPA